eukprot:TRINITY_DN1275_c0_g1_i13.p1 TRINITY_DN1275_c0_g1~~TRINITY_DN1275_c0_g1_i13.p1  ORF type:complete len:232 (+),score=104.42 TRINITY_DN1275_c0_g1_i13:77-772(+)
MCIRDRVSTQSTWDYKTEEDMPKKQSKGKKITTTESAAKRGSRNSNPLFVKRPKNFRIGNDIQPKRDLTRFVKWPRYVRIQRQKRVLLRRLKVPPVLHQFSHTLDANAAKRLFTLLMKYRTESRKEKRERLKKEAEAIKDNKEDKGDKDKKPVMAKFGLNHVTSLVENNKAKLVVIAHNVEPIELVLHLPTLCKKKEIPYCFVKGMERLGKVVHKKHITCLALTEVRKEVK